MGFVPGLILGVVIAIYKDKIIKAGKEFWGWLKGKPWRNIFHHYHFHRLKYRIATKNDIQKKTLEYFYEKNYINSKQYKKILNIYRSRRRLCIVSKESSTTDGKEKSIRTM